jgi:hypothetical protein
LDRKTLARLRQQLLAPWWELRGGQRVVENKDDTREKIGCWPDGTDALNLAYHECASGGVSVRPRRSRTAPLDGRRPW